VPDRTPPLFMLTAVFVASLGLLWLGDEIGEPYLGNA
jgi:hypothetical protein